LLVLQFIIDISGNFVHNFFNLESSFTYLALILSFLSSFSFSFVYYCPGWRYIVTFTKVLKMYQIYHSWIHLVHCYLSSPFPWFLEQFQQVSFLHLHIYIIYIWYIFASYTSSYPFPRHLPAPTGATHSTCSTLLFFNFVEKKHKRKKETWHYKMNVACLSKSFLGKNLMVGAIFGLKMSLCCGLNCSSSHLPQKNNMCWHSNPQ
jgi:hypothetical protein